MLIFGRSSEITLSAMFIASKVGKTGLTVTVDVYRIMSGSVITEVTGASATEATNGLYYYVVGSGITFDAAEYIAVFKTSDGTVEQQHIPVHFQTTNWLYAPINGVIVGQMGTNALSGGAVSSTAVTKIQAGLSTLNSTTAQAAAAAALTAYDPPTKAELDAAVAPLATSAALAIVDGIVDTIVAAVTANLDVAISSRLSAAGYTDPPSAADIRSEIDTNSTKLDANVSSRLASADYEAPANASISSIEGALVALTENDGGLRFTAKALEEAPTGGGGGATPADIWAYSTRGLNQPVTVGTNNDKTGYTLTSGNVNDIRDGLSTLTTTQVNAEVDQALADYDAPTKAELDAAVAPLATAANLTVVSGNVGAIKASTDANLDAAVSSRLPTGGYTPPPTVAAIRAEIDTNSTKLDVNVGSRLSTADYEAPANSTITAINDLLNTLTENVTGWRFTAKALETAPTGGGGGGSGFTADELKQLRQALGITGDTAPIESGGTISQILALVALLQASGVQNHSLYNLITGNITFVVDDSYDGGGDGVQVTVPNAIPMLDLTEPYITSIQLSVRSSYAEDTDPPTLTLTGTATSASSADFPMTREQSRLFRPDREYVYDAVANFADGGQRTFRFGHWYPKSDVTR